MFTPKYISIHFYFGFFIQAIPSMLKHPHYSLTELYMQEGAAY